MNTPSPDRVAIIGCAGIPANYGGFETLAENLVTELRGQFKFIVYCSAFSYPVKKTEYRDARLIYIPVNANGRSSIVYDALSILHALNKANILLILGVGGAFLLPFVRLFTRKKIIVNIDGLEWKRQKWGAFARFYLRVQESIAVKFAHKVVADNEAIQLYITSQYKRDSEYAAYGGDHARAQPLSVATQEELKITHHRYCFTVCRIEPENNIHVILEAFSYIKTIRLVIVGNWKASTYGQGLMRLYAGYANITLLDPIYDQKKLDEIRSNCVLYIHGHSAGGTNPSLVEAMNLGLPVLAWDVDYNRFTTENKALYFKNATELADLLRTMDFADASIAQRGAMLHKIAKEKYTWAIVASRYKTMLS
jgi:glycosyltransferase involved in cell wall biosynthesis